MENMNLEILKEPLGFLRVIQLIMSIFAFATTAGFSTYTSFKIDCSAGKISEVIFNFGYPFKLNQIPIKVVQCDDKTVVADLPWDFSSSAEFFVAVGVLTFLLTLLALGIYICSISFYTSNQMVPVCDLASSVLLTILWLSAASAWAHEVSNVKYYATPDNFFDQITECSKQHCVKTYTGNYASLNVSLIFGFGNFLLWAASLWFVFKETKFHQETNQQEHQQQHQQPPLYSS
ncbi:synaptophysin-like protein 1 [Limulus polyphemus]|uniref:Synaptophysin-like protein 1 n=1 Tax=Limulus polyphemus TaxID=6850 RepID=A0ABM1BNA4_LIMPO|nr:synaptophysin-like protein 1 [Limulus polyphemus]